jgi:regulatory protein
MAFGRRRFQNKRRDQDQADSPSRPPPNGLAIAGRLLGMRDHTCGELRKKLKERDLTSAQIEETMTKLAEMNLLDDARVATQLAGSLARQGWGPTRIKMKMRERDLGDEHIDAAIDALEEEPEVWVEAARARVSSKFRAEPVDMDKEERDRAFRHLIYRGYSGSVARAVLFER